MPDHHRRAVAGPLVMLALAVACDGAPPTAPAAPDAAFQLSPADSAGLVIALEDINARILPALAEGPATSLRQSLDALSRALQLRDMRAVQRAVDRLDLALDASAADDVGAELQVIRLVVAQAQALARGVDAPR